MCGQLATLCITERRWSKQLVLSCVKSPPLGSRNLQRKHLFGHLCTLCPFFRFHAASWRSGVEWSVESPGRCIAVCLLTLPLPRPVPLSLSPARRNAASSLFPSLLSSFVSRSHMQVRPTCRIQITRVISHMSLRHMEHTQRGRGDEQTHSLESTCREFCSCLCVM